MCSIYLGDVKIATGTSNTARFAKRNAAEIAVNWLHENTSIFAELCVPSGSDHFN